MLTMFAVAFGVSACVSPQTQVTQREDSLAAAGFIVKPADTPERQAMLGKLPPHHFVQRIRGNTVSYVYADPLVCDCLYVGSQKAFGLYQQEKQRQQIVDQQELTAQAYSNPNWNWGAWGPWGENEAYGGFDGPGLGW